MSILKEIRLFAIVVFNPIYWIRTTRVDKKWDKQLRKIIKTKQTVYFDSYNGFTIKIDDVCIWIENYPYCHGGNECDSFYYEPQPSRRTCILLREYLKEQGLTKTFKFKIKESAIEKDGKIYTGKRHSDIFKSIQDQGLPKDTLKGGIQGFVTYDGNFVDRKLAGKIAYKYNQIDEPTDCLISENLY